MPAAAAVASRLLEDDLVRALCLTVLYSELFDQAPTVAEVRRYLVLHAAAPEAVDGALARARPVLHRSGDLVTFGVRDDLVARRERRRRRSREMWRGARRYAAWTRRIPWVRMVAVCGSLAVGNPRSDSDVDLFLVTAPQRLWLAQVLVMQLKRRAARAGFEVCPNYFLSADALEIRGRDLFLAREAAQAVPLRGRATHRAFLRANRWIRDLLPNLERPEPGARDDSSEGEHQRPEGRSERWLETVLGRGGLGARLDRLVHRSLLSYYALRFRRRGLDRTRLAESYRPDRQEVAAGGYGASVERAFRRRVADRLGDDELVARDLDRLFPGAPAGRPAPDPTFERLLAARYGAAP